MFYGIRKYTSLNSGILTITLLSPMPMIQKNSKRQTVKYVVSNKIHANKTDSYMKCLKVYNRAIKLAIGHSYVTFPMYSLVLH